MYLYFSSSNSGNGPHFACLCNVLVVKGHNQMWPNDPRVESHLQLIFLFIPSGLIKMILTIQSAEWDITGYILSDSEAFQLRNADSTLMLVSGLQLCNDSLWTNFTGLPFTISILSIGQISNNLVRSGTKTCMDFR